MGNAVIGFIGLGIMGKPMASNPMKAGFSLVVHNRGRGDTRRCVGDISNVPCLRSNFILSASFEITRQLSKWAKPVWPF